MTVNPLVNILVPSLEFIHSAALCCPRLRRKWLIPSLD